MTKCISFLPWTLAALFFFTTVYLWRSLIKQSDDARVVRSKLMVFERVESSLRQDQNTVYNISDGPAASPAPFATPKPTWIDIDFLRRGVNIQLFEQLEKKYKDHVGMGYFAFKAENSDKGGRPTVEENPQFRTDFREKPYPHDLTHGISWLMDLSRFVKVKVESEDNKMVLLTSMIKPDRSRKYYPRTQQIWKYAKRHQYAAAHCFHKEMLETTNYNFSLLDPIWKPMCIRGALQKKDFSKTDYLLWIDEETFIRPKYQHIPLTHFTDPVGVAFPVIVQDTGDIPDIRVFFLRNIAAGQRLIYFWILELYMQIWCTMGKCSADSRKAEMAFCSVYVDELMLARNVEKRDTSIDRYHMKHPLRQVIDSNVGKPYLFFDNFVSFFIESLGKYGVHSQFSDYDHWSPPVRFLGTLKEPTGPLGAMQEKKMLGPNEQVARKADNPSMWFFASKQGDPSRSFISIEEKYLNETAGDSPKVIDSPEEKVINTPEINAIDAKANLADRSEKVLVDSPEKEIENSQPKNMQVIPEKKEIAVKKIDSERKMMSDFEVPEIINNSPKDKKLYDSKSEGVEVKSRKESK